MKKFKNIVLIIVLILILYPLTIFSAGFHVNVEQGMKAMSLGGAFGKMNTRLHEPKLYDTLTLRYRDIQGQKHMDSNWALIPSFYASFKLNNKITLGIGFFSPFGTATDWTHTWIGRYSSDKTELLTYNINPTIAYKINQKTL